MRDKDDLDALLDEALATYADIEESSNFSVRVLAAVRQNENRRAARGWLPWAIALPVAAAVLIAMLVSPHRTTSRESRSISQVATPSVVPRIPEAAMEITPHVIRTVRPLRTRATNEVRSAIHKLPVPKQQVFPTPQPLSREEEALVFLAHRNAAVPAQLIDASSHDVKPLSIAAIHISPLNPPDKGGN